MSTQCNNTSLVGRWKNQAHNIMFCGGLEVLVALGCLGASFALVSGVQHFKSLSSSDSDSHYSAPLTDEERLIAQQRALPAGSPPRWTVRTPE